MDRTLLTLTPANVITVSLCGLLGFGLLVLASKLYAKLTGQQIGGSAGSAAAGA